MSERGSKLFTAFLVMVLLGMLLLAIKLFLTRKFDRWFAAGFTLLTASSVGISLGARTRFGIKSRHFCCADLWHKNSLVADVVPRT
ncbi:MAG: hypothetical protein R3F31_20050 [Verrucomicrobiales bacterium]